MQLMKTITGGCKRNMAKQLLSGYIERTFHVQWFLTEIQRFYSFFLFLYTSKLWDFKPSNALGSKGTK